MFCPTDNVESLILSTQMGNACSQFDRPSTNQPFLSCGEFRLLIRWPFYGPAHSTTSDRKLVFWCQMVLFMNHLMNHCNCDQSANYKWLSKNGLITLLLLYILFFETLLRMLAYKTSPCIILKANKIPSIMMFFSRVSLSPSRALKLLTLNLCLFTGLDAIIVSSSSETLPTCKITRCQTKVVLTKEVALANKVVGLQYKPITSNPGTYSKTGKYRLKFSHNN